MVKRFMRNASREPEQYRGMPSMPDELRPKLKTIGKVVVASAEEMQQPPRTKCAAANCGAHLMQPSKSSQPFLLVFVFALVCV